MMREKYESLPLATLKELAKTRGLKGISTMKKAEVIELMLKEDENEKKKEKKSSQETVKAVSYTHLDVYKRQGGNSLYFLEEDRDGDKNMKSLNEDIKTGVFKQIYLLYGEEAVSYTHLDVYKRQAYYRISD